MPAHRVGEGSSEGRSVRQELPPWGGSKGKHAQSSYDEVESQSSSRDRGNKQAKGSTEPNYHRHGPLPREGDLQAKLVARAATVANPILSARSKARTTRFALKEQLLPNPFVSEIEGTQSSICTMVSLTRVTHHPFLADDGTLESPRHIHVQGVSIKPGRPQAEGISSLLTLRKGKNETLHNYSKRYWELYSEIEQCSEELAIASYNLGLTSSEKLWDDLMVNSPAKLQDLLTRVEMYARLEEDVE
ncbi:hypothetical protein Acr_10g0005860 [Actinidia rufa]|uniref:Uncharacterized protein n=1 Tax=Actinidia rufa TaxID=165716 RepID=A0A7J0F976_9ERIC|nr:hypothetical protein Acr_10g0005860 [Actinidia rufa]